ncbi:helix-turn-helix domain-containing protein [Ovoidimarina sediminis]|uniref:helix-turn-helix domain-containing protein n=1 Tax=Ovoidimarina sediminis TaxID=3079856 RepID=UPI00290EAEEE|nr:helix-turn-helix domain-containing protein [Rhodophyticola sp. MJ-SS7]MDU8942382.1 helix-turn-helix domain-containing protein [Rhodophyticola sp. MJ-SS7]
MARNKGKRSEGQYALMPYALLKSPAWRSLSGAAIKVYFELHARFNGGNNGRITLSYAEAAEALGMGKATVQRAYNELVEHGLLALEEPGNWYHRRAHEWRLTTKQMQRVRDAEPATNDWRKWRPEKTERGSDTDPSPSSVVPFENPKASLGSTSEPVSAKSRRSLGSETEH